MALLATSAPLLLAARRSGADAGCGYSAPRGRTFAYGPSAPIRLHDTRTDTRTLPLVAPQASFTLLLDSSSRFYVFDQDLADTSRDLGAAVGRACLPDETLLGRAASSHCGPLPLSPRPASFCYDYPNPNAQLIHINDVPRHCLPGGLGSSIPGQCPNDVCAARCDLHIPAECIGARDEASLVGANHWVVPRYDRSIPVNWARLPYVGGSNGEEEVVQLVTANGQPWTPLPRSVRNYDLGVCGAFVTYQALANLVNEQFFPQYAASLYAQRTAAGVPRVRSAELLLSELKAGPLLRGTTFASSDLVSLWFRTDAAIDVEDFTLGQTVYLGSNVFARLRVSTVSPSAGVWRLSIGGDIEPGLTWNYPGTDGLHPNISATVAGGLRGTATTPGLATSLADAVTRLFLQGFPLGPPRIGRPEEGSNLRCERHLIGTDAGVATCVGLTFGLPVASGPEFGCHDELEFSPAAQAAMRFDFGRINASNEVRGVCATRLQARRVNVLPDELEIVLAEQEDESSTMGLAGRQQMTQFLRTAIAASPQGVAPGIRLACDDKNGAGWNPVPQGGHIAQSGTLGMPMTSVQRCDGQQACAALRPSAP